LFVEYTDVTNVTTILDETAASDRVSRYMYDLNMHDLNICSTYDLKMSSDLNICNTYDLNM